MIQMGNMCKFVIILILSLGIVSGQQCTQQNIDNCIQPFTAYRNVANLTEPMLNEACSKVSNISVCVTNSGCPADDPMVKATWTGLQDGFNYLCGKKSDVLSKVSCWHNNDTRSILEACQNAYNATARAALCDAANKLLACTKTGLTTRCGADSADLYVTYTYKVLYPAIKALQSNCTLNDLSGSSAGVAFSASFITVLLASSALLLML